MKLWFFITRWFIQITTTTTSTTTTTTTTTLSSTEITTEIIETDVTTLPPLEEIIQKCIVDDVEYNHLDDIPNNDPCQLCQCVDGNVICAVQDCSGPPENYKNCKPKKVEGECCPKYECDDETTSRAEDNITEITTAREPKPLDEIVPKVGTEDDDKDETVEAPSMTDNIIFDGDEILDDDTDDYTEDVGDCIEGGNLYRNTDEVPHSNKCKFCFCNSGIVICADRECPVPKDFEGCNPLPAPKEQCCPDQFECSKSLI